MNPVEAYFEQVRAIHLSGAGVPETSYYPALSNLFDEIGKTLNPKVRCIINLANRGAGLPDGGLFTADQLRRTAEVERRFSLADDLDRIVTANLHRSSRLRQSILSAAFAGSFTGRYDTGTPLELPMAAEAPGAYSSGRSRSRSASRGAKGGPA